MIFLVARLERIKIHLTTVNKSAVIADHSEPLKIIYCLIFYFFFQYSLDLSAPMLLFDRNVNYLNLPFLIFTGECSQVFQETAHCLASA